MLTNHTTKGMNPRYGMARMAPTAVQSTKPTPTLAIKLSIVLTNEAKVWPRLDRAEAYRP